MTITLDTKVGELIPEGEYCKDCIFLGGLQFQYWCRIAEDKLITEYQPVGNSSFCVAVCYMKHLKCPKRSN